VTQDINSLLSSYPRRRPALPSRQAEVYEKEYTLNRDGGSLITSLSRGLEKWMHLKVASVGIPGDVLEIGAGTLNQLVFENKHANYDIIEPFCALYQDRPELGRIREVFSDISELPPERRYDRITSVAVLEHLEDLPNIVATSALRLNNEGVFQAGIPSEGGALWHFSWRTTTGVAYWLRNKLDYGKLMRHEHLNSAQDIELVVGNFFDTVEVRRFPTPARHLSFYTYLSAKNPNRARAAEFLRAGAYDTK